jgi:hypothetical protein
MKRQTILIALVGIITAAGFAESASAMLHTGMGRFMQRDPYGTTRVTEDRVTPAPALHGRAVQRDARAMSLMSNRRGLSVNRFQRGSQARSHRPTFGTSVASASPGASYNQKDVAKQYTDGMSLYQYVRSNPNRWNDPSGLVCGSGGNDQYIPDGGPGYDFTGPCQWHDDCYGTCGKQKSFCDGQFLRFMLAECKKLYWFDPRRTACANQALAYFHAVKHAGGGAYDAAQDDACDDDCSS